MHIDRTVVTGIAIVSVNCFYKRLSCEDLIRLTDELAQQAKLDRGQEDRFPFAKNLKALKIDFNLSETIPEKTLIGRKLAIR